MSDKKVKQYAKILKKHSDEYRKQGSTAVLVYIQGLSFLNRAKVCFNLLLKKYKQEEE